MTYIAVFLLGAVIGWFTVIYTTRLTIVRVHKEEIEVQERHEKCKYLFDQVQIIRKECIELDSSRKQKTENILKSLRTVMVKSDVPENIIKEIDFLIEKVNAKSCS